jgi:hypothetical protein
VGILLGSTVPTHAPRCHRALRACAAGLTGAGDVFPGSGLGLLPANGHRFTPDYRILVGGRVIVVVVVVVVLV